MCADDCSYECSYSSEIGKCPFLTIFIFRQVYLFVGVKNIQEFSYN